MSLAKRLHSPNQLTLRCRGGNGKTMNTIVLTEELKGFLGPDFIVHGVDIDWGTSIKVMDKAGHSFSHTYCFKDQQNAIFLEDLSVIAHMRGQGLAAKHLKAHMRTASVLNLTSMLWTEKDSFAYYWYKRKGYENFVMKDSEEYTIWLKK